MQRVIDIVRNKSKIKMSTNLQNNKRETRQIRISTNWHKKIKLQSIEKEMTISKLADSILEEYFNKIINFKNEDTAEA